MCGPREIMLYVGAIILLLSLIKEVAWDPFQDEMF